MLSRNMNYSGTNLIKFVQSLYREKTYIENLKMIQVNKKRYHITRSEETCFLLRQLPTYWSNIALV